MSNVLPSCDLTALFCAIDDTLVVIEKDKSAVGRPSLLCDSEMVTILIYNTLLLHQKNLKDIWRFTIKYHRHDFPKIPKYSAFVDHVHRILPLMLELLSLSLVKADINFTDSTMLEVCKLHRVDSHKVAKLIAKFGKNHQGWHYGFKLHASINWQGLFTSFCFSSANIYDAQMLPCLVKDFMKIIVGDSQYGASVMRKFIHEKTGIIIIAPPHYKQRLKLATMWQNALLSMRSKIESVYDVLKEHLHLVSSFPRSLGGYFVHYVRILLAYQFSLLFKSA